MRWCSGSRTTSRRRERRRGPFFLPHSRRTAPRTRSPSPTPAAAPSEPHPTSDIRARELSMSTYKGLDLFGPGPHRFAEGPRGEVTDSELFQSPPNSGSRYIGPAELTVIVSGRLVAPTEAELWDAVDAIAAQIIHPPAPGLLDAGPRSWADMSFVHFAPADRVDRGREVSLAYTTKFLKFREYPQS